MTAQAGQRVRSLYREIYGDNEASQLALRRLDDVLERRTRERSTELQHRDATRRGWYMSGLQVGYSCYADRFGGSLTGVKDRIPHLHQLGVSYLHLLPIFATVGPANDGGFAVADYQQIDARLGTMADLRALTEELHHHDMTLCLDFIANHTSRHHEWAQKAVQGLVPFDQYYHFLASQEDVESAERALDEVFPQSAPGNFVYVPQRSAWVWSTFQAYQWDLNYANPLVSVEMVDTLLFLANQGVDALRVDSAPFLWKERGSPSRGLRQTHLILQLFRAAIDLVAPSVALLAEAIVAPRALNTYLGAHEPPVPECHIAYQGVLMPMLWLTLVKGDARPLRRILQSRVDPPPETTWLQYVRSHDNIEWEVLSPELLQQANLEDHDVKTVVEFLHGKRPMSFSAGLPFEGGVGQRLSTNGTTASLCGLTTAETDEEERLALDRILLLYGVLFALPGFPVIFGGDELGMENDPSYLERAAERTDSRWLHRPFIDWQRAMPEHTGASIFEGLQRLAEARQATADLTVFSVPSLPENLPPGLLLLERHSPDRDRLTVVANVGPQPIQWALEDAKRLGLVGRATERISGGMQDGAITTMGAYGIGWYLWRRDDA